MRPRPEVAVDGEQGAETWHREQRSRLHRTGSPATLQL